jgi:hypothetical protein
MCIIRLFSKLNYLAKYMYALFTFGYYCKPVLESADKNVYKSKKKRNMPFKKKYLTELKYLVICRIVADSVAFFTTLVYQF